MFTKPQQQQASVYFYFLAIYLDSKYIHMIKIILFQIYCHEAAKFNLYPTED